MIGTKYTPELLAALAKTPHLKGMEVAATPDGRRIASYTRRYTDERECKTTFFGADVGVGFCDVELASTTVDFDAEGARFGSLLGCDVEKVTVSSLPDGLCVSFFVDLWPEEGLDKRSVAFSARASVEIESEVSAVSVIEETHTGVDTVTSFFEDDTSYKPWLVIVEPDRKEA